MEEIKEYLSEALSFIDSYYNSYASEGVDMPKEIEQAKEAIDNCIYVIEQSESDIRLLFNELEYCVSELRTKIEWGD